MKNKEKSISISTDALSALRDKALAMLEKQAYEDTDGVGNKEIFKTLRDAYKFGAMVMFNELLKAK